MAVLNYYNSYAFNNAILLFVSTYDCSQKVFIQTCLFFHCISQEKKQKLTTK